MRRRNCKLRDFSNQGSKINCARFSRKLGMDEDGQLQQNKHEYFVTGDNHNNIRFYEFLGEEQLQCFGNTGSNAVQSEVSAVAISCTQVSIYSGSNRGIINVWDILQGKNTPLCTLKGHGTSVNCFGVFPEEDTRIASGSYDTYIKLWDVREKNNYAMLKHHSKPINSIDISPDGNCLLSGSEDNTAKLWDLRSPQKVLSTYAEHEAPVIKVIFNPEECMFASCSTDRTVKYFSCDKKKGAYLYVSSTELVSMPITAIDFNLDGSLLCTAGNDILKIWDMRKNGLLIQSIDSAWKGVQDVLWCQKGIKGLSSYGGYLSVWFCYLGDQMEQSNKKQQQELRLPKLFKNVSGKRESNLYDDKKIKQLDNKQGQQNQKLIDRNKDLQQVMNNVNLALGHLNNVTQMKNRQQKQKSLQAKKQLQQKRKQQQKQKQQQRKQRIRIQKQKERQQKQQKQRQRREKLQKQLQQQQKIKQQKLQQLQQQRLQRQKQLQEKLHQTFQNNNNKNNGQLTLHNDILENSSVMNISVFIDNATQKEKLVQIETIAQLMKQRGRFQSVFKIRSSSVKPIIHYWKQGKIDSAIYTLSQADIAVAYDCISAIIHNSTFKMGITPDAACGIIKKLIQIMNNKHSTYVKNAMSYLNEIVLMFKDELIKIKMFNPMTRVDLSREERLAKYDKLTQNFLNVFKQERLKKYACTAKSAENEELYGIAAQLYKNLEEMLRKIIPRKQADAA